MSRTATMKGSSAGRPPPYQSQPNNNYFLVNMHESSSSSPYVSDTVSFLGEDNMQRVSDDVVSFTDEDFVANPMVHTINNSQLEYVTIHLRSGINVNCRPQVLIDCGSILSDLDNDVSQCLRLLPESVHGLVKRTRIWVNHRYCYGPRQNPTIVKHSTAHHDTEWLLWARDVPDKVHGIEIYNCFDYQRMRLHWNGCGLLLHEFCHIIHQFALDAGLYNPLVIQAFINAKTSGLYENVLRRDWAGMEEDQDLAYAMVNHKEFFAELSVAYLCDNYHHLDDGACFMMERCCPPLRAQHVIDRVVEEMKTDEKWKTILVGNDKTQDGFFLLWTLFQKDSAKKYTQQPCNKFYPFTRGQLRIYDPSLFEIFQILWSEIARWDDPIRSDNILCFSGSCWSFLGQPTTSFHT